MAEIEKGPDVSSDRFTEEEKEIFKKSLLDSEKIDEEKKELIASLSYYPDRVSAKYLPEDLNGKKVLDVGSGERMGLQQVIEKQKGMYVPVDNEEIHLKNRKDEHKIQAEAEQLPFNDSSFDVVHSRFMLRHLSPENRRKAISEMYRVGRQVILIDYDWEGLEKEIQKKRKEFTGNQIAQKILDLQESWVVALRGWTPAKEMDMAIKTKDEVQKTLGIDVKESRDVRPSSDNYWEMTEKELINLGGDAAVKKWKSLSSEDQKVISLLMPDMIIVTFSK